MEILDKKRFNTLYTNGCSWTWGGALEMYWNNHNEREKLVWPYHLSNKLNIEKTINHALGCGSNQRIVRTTLDWIFSKSQEELYNTLVIIQWSDPSRFEYYVPKNDDDSFESLHNRWILNKTDHVIDSFTVNGMSDHRGFFTLDDPNELDDRVLITNDDHLYNKNKLSRETDIESTYTFFTQMETLYSILNLYNVRHYFWTFDGTIFKIFEESPIFSKVKHRYNWLTIKGYEQWCMVTDVPSHLRHDGHPTLNGHKQISQMIYSNIQNEIYT